MGILPLNEEIRKLQEKLDELNVNNDDILKRIKAFVLTDDWTNLNTNRVVTAAWRYLTKDYRFSNIDSLRLHESDYVTMLYDKFFKDRYGSVHPVYCIKMSNLATAFLNDSYMSTKILTPIWKTLVEDEGLIIGLKEWRKTLKTNEIVLEVLSAYAKNVAVYHVSLKKELDIQDVVFLTYKEITEYFTNEY